MDNKQNPFASRRQNTLPYNRIKRNRAFRSEKKFTEAQPSPFDQALLSKTDLRALLDALPQNEGVFQNCIEELKQKIDELKSSPKQKQPLQHLPYSNHQPYKQKCKTYRTQTQPRVGSQSLNLLPKEQKPFPPALLDLQLLRNEVKRRKQANQQRLSTEKQRSFTEKQRIATEQPRLPTEQRCQRYLDFSEQDQGLDRPKRGSNRHESVKLRSNTEEVIRSAKNPARLYHPNIHKDNQTNKPIRKSSIQLAKERKIDNDRIDMGIKRSPTRNQSSPTVKQETPIDNNEKIGDLSTIFRQKETLNFLGDSCLGIHQQLSPKKQQPPSTKLLTFVDWRTNELKNVFSASKQKKRKAGIDKLSKMFPKGFFS